MDGAREVLTERQRRRIAALTRGSSIEISPKDPLAGDALRDLFAPDTIIFVAHPPSASCEDVVAACVRLGRAGFTVIPHVAARRLASLMAASDFLQRAAGEAGVAEALVIGGDPDWPAGPFRDATSLVESGVLECFGLDRVGFAAYPEGHPYIPRAALATTLDAKLALSRRHGLAPSLVTQFGFEAAPIVNWLAALRARGVDCPVRIGIAGPASVVTLAHFAVRCGIGASMRALARGHLAFARILSEAAPDGLITALVAGETADAPIDGLHLFTFGGVRRTAEWMQGFR